MLSNWTLRLCLVAVKRFLENTYFPEMLISGKGKCFHGVWLHFKKFSEKYFLVFGKEEGKHKSRKTQAITQEKIINDDTEHRPTTAPSIAIQDRDREIAIDGEIAIFARSRRQSRSRSGREIAINGVARSRTGDCDQRRRDRRLEIAINDNEIAIARARSLSLSFFGNTLKGK